MHFFLQLLPHIIKKSLSFYPFLDNGVILTWLRGWPETLTLLALFFSFHSPFIAVPNISAQGTFHLEIGYLVLDRSGSPVPRRCRSSYSSLSPSCQLESWRNLSLTRCQPWVWRSPKRIQGMLVEWKRKQTCCICCWELHYYAHITSRLY